MKTAKSIILPSIFTALLIGGQFALSGIYGIEIVTVLFLCFCYKYGVKQGLLVANAFSLLRCLIFGFYPCVIVLYLIYYNLFALVFGGLGNLFKHEYSVKKHVITVILAVVMTICFTMIDNVLTPVWFGFSFNAAKSYFFASLPIMTTQSICAFVTVTVFFPVILKILKKF